MNYECPCGWPHDSLRKALAEREKDLAEVETSIHPFRNAMAAGEKKAIATLKAHLSGDCTPKTSLTYKLYLERIAK